MSGETHLDFTANRNGHESSAPGNLGFDQIELRSIDKRQAEVKEKKAGAIVATIREKISNDGKELTTTTATRGPCRSDHGVDAERGREGCRMTPSLATGRRISARPVCGKVWCSKSRRTAGGGIRFLGDFSYTARFDGKQYDLKNSRNDTVMLELVDPSTVDASYQRDNQITQKDRWVVSADGQQMTLSTTGTLETGQRVTEQLVFKKQ